MPRKNRVWYPGAVYHIMCRGNHRQDIFREKEDWQVYLYLLRNTRDKFPFTLHTYCLMTNHVHLQIETLDVEIGKIMKRLNMLYAVYFNQKYNFVGHLFQGRYRAELIQNDAHCLEISRYIHLNPVRASIVEHPIDYPWSSYRNYLGTRNSSLVTIDKILGYFQNNSPSLYQKYVEG